ncbi:MAG: IS1 family transposase, partial [Cyanobacteria bacterium J06641_5]
MSCCPYCKSDQKVVKKGFNQRQDGTRHQRYLCRSCDRQFNDRTGTPMARLRKSPAQVAKTFHMRSEGLGGRATGRVKEIAHATVMRWERRLFAQAENWSPPAPANSDLTVEGDELYTKVE